MFELLEFLFEEIADVVSDLFDSGADAADAATSVTDVPVADVPVADVPVADVPVAEAPLAGGGESTSWGAFDGGNTDRFDPKPLSPWL